MINKTTGIVMRVSPFSKTSHVVTWLTSDHGKISTAVKGAVRPKSAFLGQYDLFYSCEVLYYARERGGAHILRECSPLNTRHLLRTDWRAVSCASYFCDLASRSCPPGAPNREFFHLLDRTLTLLCQKCASIPTLLWFELKAMDVTGLAPRLLGCLDCNRPLPEDDSPVEFSCSRGGVLCARCAGNRAGSALTSISGRTLVIMQKLQESSSPDNGESADIAGPDLIQIANLLGAFLEYHAHSSLPSRAIAMELLLG